MNNMTVNKTTMYDHFIIYKATETNSRRKR